MNPKFNNNLRGNKKIDFCFMISYIALSACLLRGRSASTNLLEFCCQIFKAFFDHKQTYVTITDLPKSFHSVYYEFLGYKLHRLGFLNNVVA